ncbi:MAG: branched-chain amino acid ABC transporter substrate-binding protein [Actinomycetota bacterium]|nr:branched-chain amino acid ABC transporter substrate-binding protein [Actinomycetota bacterium]MDH5224231.1 branched-chain amino acid ABC transporter substrate-binding protein [Actinomycetota bacterium]
MKRRSWLTVVATVAVLALVASACSNDDSGGGSGGGGGTDTTSDEFGTVEIAAGEPINIGTLLVISGADATLGLDSQHGAELAADYLDGTFDATPGQLLGHDIKWTHEDDLCSAEGGQAGATALAADPSIVAVIGTSCSSAALGVADTVTSEKGILLFSPSNTNPALTGEEAHQPFYARTAHNDRIQGAIVAEFALNEQGATTMATIHDESPYTQGLTAAAAVNFEAGGGTVSVQEQINSEDTDFKPLLRSIAEGNPDVLYAPVFVAACSLILKQAADIMPDVTLMASDGCLSSDTLKLAGDAVDGVFVSGPDVTVFQEGDFYSNEFIPAYKDQYGDPTSVFHAHAFDAANVLFDAIEQVAVENDDGSLSIGRTALRDAVFATSGYEGMTGIITCTELGDCATDVTIGIFEGPNWPVEGGAKPDDPVYSDTKSLDDVA